MRISEFAKADKQKAKVVSDCLEYLYKDLFIWASKCEKESIVSNTLLVHLGLIKVTFLL